MTTSAYKALHTRIASAMQSAGVETPSLAATIALNIIRDEFARCEGDVAKANDLAMVLMGVEE